LISCFKGPTDPFFYGTIRNQAKILLSTYTRPTTAHILGGCPVALTQQRYTYRHDQVLNLLASKLKEIFSDYSSIHVFADLQGLRASEAPQATIPSTLLITPYRPDIVVYNSDVPSIALLELTCPLDSEHNIESARSRKQNKVEYHQLLAEFDRLHIQNYYETIEISVLGHYLPSSINNIRNFTDFLKLSVTTKSSIRQILDNAARQSMLCSQKIFLARNCSVWTTELSF